MMGSHRGMSWVAPAGLLLFAVAMTNGCGAKAAGMHMSYVVPGTPAGACTLEYNSGLVDPSADRCCARVGGPNTCNPDTACNATTGSPCCVIYATQVTVGGMGCCHYSNGDPVSGTNGDRTEECEGLLAGR